MEEAWLVLANFREALAQQAGPRLILASSGPSCSGSRWPAHWEQSLREQYRDRYGPPLLPLPNCLEESALLMALRLSPRHMPAGMREAAEELFKDPAFLAGVATALVVYIVAWAAPEPIFTKSFAITVTVVLSFAFSLAELTHLGLVAHRLYQDTEGSRTLAEIEAAAERFGKSLGGAGLRAMVFVASRGMAKALPKVPPGGLRALLAPPRYAVAAGLELTTATSVQAVADGTLLIAGVAAGVTGSTLRSACKDGSSKLAGYKWHHLATNKNHTATVRGGPWTPRFEKIFAQAGMTLDARENQVYLEAHEGPHPEEYHDAIYERLRAAVSRCRTQQVCRARLVEELERIAGEVCTPGSKLHRLVMRAPEGT